MSESETQNLPAVSREKHSLRDMEVHNHGMGAHLVPQSMADVVKFADVMSRGGISLPKHLRERPGDCLAVCIQALDWGMNPIAVANKTYSVNDRMAYEAQLIAAVIHARAPISGRPKYAYVGEPKSTRQCTVSVTTTDGEVLEYTSPAVKDITVKNSPLWKADEDQQLGYFSIRSLARRYFPELLLGVYDREETEAMRDVSPRHRETTGLRERMQANRIEHGDKGFNREFVEQAIDGEFEESPGHADLMVEPEVIDAIPDERIPDLSAAVGEDPRAIAQWIEDFKARCLQAETKQELIAIRADFMDSHIRPLYPIAPQRMEELDNWFGGHLKTLPKGA